MYTGLATTAKNRFVKKPHKAPVHGPDKHAIMIVPIISRNKGSLSVEHSVPPIRLIPTAMGINTNDFVADCNLMLLDIAIFFSIYSLLQILRKCFPKTFS